MDKHSCFGNCGFHQQKKINIRYTQNNLYKCRKGHVMIQDKRPSLLLTFVQKIRLLALICFKLEGTSGLTGNRGHRGHTMCHEERPSQTFTLEKESSFYLKQMIFYWFLKIKIFNFKWPVIWHLMTSSWRHHNAIIFVLG